MRITSSVCLAVTCLLVQASAFAAVRFYGEELPTQSESIIYVIDTSGSMNFDNQSYTGLDGNPTRGSRLDQAKVELIRSIQSLSEDATFNIIAYDCEVARFAPARVVAGPAERSAAAAWIQNLRPHGATGTGPAVALALEDKNNFTVVLLSDGAPNCMGGQIGGSIDPPDGIVGVDLDKIDAANTQRAVIHCFGIAATGEFRQFMVDVASHSGGRYFDVP